MKKILFSLLFFSSFSFVFASSTGEYSTLMEKLDLAQKNIISETAQQKEKVADEYVQLQNSLEKEYGYISLHCLGILTLNYTGNTTVHDNLLQKLVDFNTQIYANKIGLSGDLSDIHTKLDTFIDSGIESEARKIYTSFASYKEHFLKDMQSYILKNESLIVPLAKRMKLISDMKDEYLALEAIATQSKNTLYEDSLLKSLPMIKDKFYEFFSRSFDAAVQNKTSIASQEKILSVKQEYLDNFERDFEDLYLIILGEPLFELDMDNVSKFLDKYYPENQYQCNELISEESEYVTLQNRVYSQLETEKKSLGKFVDAVEDYKRLSVSNQKDLKLKMILSLKKILDDYKSANLRMAILEL